MTNLEKMELNEDLQSYTVIFNNGKILNIRATIVEWFGREKMVRFFHGDEVVARINMDAIVGWARTDHIIESDPIIIFKEDEK